jgi:hypothetical protein
MTSPAGPYPTDLHFLYSLRHQKPPGTVLASASDGIVNSGAPEPARDTPTRRRKITARLGASRVVAGQGGTSGVNLGWLEITAKLERGAWSDVKAVTGRQPGLARDNSKKRGALAGWGVILAWLRGEVTVRSSWIPYALYLWVQSR